MPPRYGLARRRASQLLATAAVVNPPVPVEVLATTAGAKIRYEPLKGETSGMVHCRPDGTAVIGVNSMHAETRRRFTIAHELGHFLLHRDEEFHIDERFPIFLRSEVSGQAVDDKEIEANQFAAHLLMPVEFLARDLKSLSLDIQSEKAIGELARRYKVSAQAMTIRLSSLLGLIRS